MKLNTFWPWLILSKTSVICATQSQSSEMLMPVTKLNCVSVLAIENSPLQALPKSMSFIQHGFSLTHAPLSFFPKRRPRSVRYLRHLDHSFLISGLHRFGEHLGGGAFNLLIIKNLLEIAHPQWLMEIFFFQSRLTQLFSLSRSRNILSIANPSHPWYGGPQVIISAVCSRDPFLLTQWINRRMRTMKLFAHRRFLRLLGSFLKTYVNLSPSATTILGFTLVTTGKISVTGNAMSRTMLVRFGKAGINNLSYRASSAFTLINTKTGCLGLNLTFYY